MLFGAILLYSGTHTRAWLLSFGAPREQRVYLSNVLV